MILKGIKRKHPIFVSLKKTDALQKLGSKKKQKKYESEKKSRRNFGKMPDSRVSQEISQSKNSLEVLFEISNVKEFWRFMERSKSVFEGDYVMEFSVRKRELK